MNSKTRKGLKRLMTAAMGALGLGALAAGPAPAQQIPAPDYLNDQAVCAANSAMAASTAAAGSVTPTAGTGAGKTGPSVLAQAKYGSTGRGDPRVIPYGSGTLLKYVVPNTYANCGYGVTLSAAADGYELANGYTKIAGQHTRVKNARSILEAAKKALDGLSPTAGDTLRGTYRDAYDDALAEYEEANEELSARAAGPIYQAGLAEYKAMEAVASAITRWDAAVSPLSSARLTLEAASHAGHVPLAPNAQALLDNLTDASGDFVLAALDAYVGTNSNGVTDGFDVTGKLLAADAAEATSVWRIRRNLKSAEDAIAAIDAALQTITNAIVEPKLGIARDQAEKQRSHLQDQLNAAYADTTDQDNDPATTGDNIAAYHATFRSREDTLNEAGRELDAAVRARELATGAVLDAFQNAESYFDQDVERHAYLKNAADAAVAAAGPTPSRTLTDAAAAAKKALDAVAKSRDDHQAFVQEGNPAADLLVALTAPDGVEADDDGQALVEAISRTYAATGKNEDAIAGLTADTADGAEKDGPVIANRKAIDALTADTGDGADADGPVTANAKRLDSLDGRVADNRKDIDALKGDSGASGGVVAANTENIAANAAAIVDNAGHIAVNAGHIAANASNIASNAGNIAANAGRIASNAGNIAVNASNIVDNRGLIRRNAATLVEHGAFIERNAGHIAQNGERIGANAAAIGMNSGLIADNRHLIGELSGELDMVRAGVAASIALSRMPSVDGGGISFGAGTFAGEMAYAVGFQVERGFGTFDVGLTSSGGEIGAGVGVGLKVWH